MVAPLRAARRALAARAKGPEPELLPLYRQLQATELAAEQVEQAILFRHAATCPPAPGSPTLARHNLALLLTDLPGDPPAPPALLAALAADGGA